MQKKQLTKPNTPFMLRNLSKVGTEGNFFNLIRNIYEKLIANIILIDEKLERSPTKIRYKARISPLITLFQYRTRNPS